MPKKKDYISLLRHNYAMDRSAVLGALEDAYGELSLTVAEMLHLKAELRLLDDKLTALKRESAKAEDDMLEFRLRIGELNTRMGKLTDRFV